MISSRLAALGLMLIIGCQPPPTEPKPIACFWVDSVVSTPSQVKAPAPTQRVPEETQNGLELAPKSPCELKCIAERQMEARGIEEIEADCRKSCASSGAKEQ